MLRWWRSRSLFLRLIVIYVGGLVTVQLAYITMESNSLWDNYRDQSSNQAIDRFTQLAQLYDRAPDTPPPFGGRGRMRPQHEAIEVTDGPPAATWLAAPGPDHEVAQRLAARLTAEGLDVEAVEAAYGYPESHGRPSYTWLAVKLEPHPRWLSGRYRGNPPPFRLSYDDLLVNGLVVAGIGFIGVLLLRFQLGAALGKLRETTGRIGGSKEDVQIPVDGPAEFRPVLEAFNQMTARVRELLIEKDVMLGAIGHDLRTPLTSLRLRVEQMEPPEERARMIQTIDETTQLLNDILELAKADAAADEVKRYDLSSIVEDVVADAQDLGRDVSADCEVRVVAACRPASIRRLLQNLIGNAIAYAGSAQVTLAKAGDEEVRLVVEDNGPGVPEDALATLIKPFRRGEASRNRGKGGSGLGLAISNAIAEAHGGRLTLANKTPTGLRVEVVLPA